MNKLSQIPLISSEMLQLYSDIARSVGTDKLFPYVTLAQPFYIEPVLGSPLTAELTLQISNGNITQPNQALLLKIAPVLALYTQYLGIRGLAYSIVEKGLVKLKSENSEPLSDKELAQFIFSTKENAEMAKELLIKYLCECQDQYPLWRPENDCGCDKYIKKPDEGSTSVDMETHIYFPKKSKNSCGCK